MVIIRNPKKREASAYKVKVAQYCFDFEGTIFVHLDLLDQLKFLSLLDKGLCCCYCRFAGRGWMDKSECHIIMSS